MKIVVLDGYAANPGDLSWEELKQLGDLTIYDRTPQELVVERSLEAEAVLVNKVSLTRELIMQLPKLKYIGELATGYNNIDLEAARERGVIVTNIPAYSTMSVAQHVIALLLNVTNHVDEFARKNRNGRWSASPDFCYWDEPLCELSGKTMGIVGLGHIGQSVARLALCLGMKVIAVSSKPADKLPEGIDKVTMEQLLSQSDVISLHCPLVKDGPKGTYHLINAETLRMMKSEAILINTGRGPLVDEPAVAEALHNNQLAAYCADVTAEEPPHISNPLLREPHAYLTPHVAWATVEARQRLMDICVANVKALIEGNPINVVN
ncbi:MAG: D-2-hydroxyacid dehydrogenase [Prevotella sp.]